MLHVDVITDYRLCILELVCVFNSFLIIQRFTINDLENPKMKLHCTFPRKQHYNFFLCRRASGFLAI